MAVFDYQGFLISQRFINISKIFHDTVASKWMRNLGWNLNGK